MVADTVNSVRRLRVPITLLYNWWWWWLLGEEEMLVWVVTAIEWVSGGRKRENWKQTIWFTSMLFGKTEQQSMNVKMCAELPHHSVDHIVSKPILSPLTWSYLLACLRMGWTGNVIIFRWTCMTYIWVIGENWCMERNLIMLHNPWYERVKVVWWKWRVVEGEGMGVVPFGWKQTLESKVLPSRCSACISQFAPTSSQHVSNCPTHTRTCTLT